MLKLIYAYNSAAEANLAEKEAKAIKGLFYKIKRENITFNEAIPLIESARAIAGNDNFLKLLNCNNVPSDCRVYTWHAPTYYVAAILMHYALKENDPILGNPSYSKFFYNLLIGSTARDFRGHGYDAMETLAETMLVFSDAGVYKFITLYPDFCPKFTDLIERTTEEITKYLKYPQQPNSFEPDCTELIQKVLINKTPAENRVFVYGTLLTDHTNNILLKNAVCCGEYILENYALYDLGDYPAIIKASGSQVIGELWLINSTELSALHHLESEGKLYKYTPVELHLANIRIDAHTYVYLHEVRKAELMDVTRLPWRSPLTIYVWYAAYGSNLLEERFLHYIQGGTCKYNKKNYAGCSDKSLPLKTIPIKIKGQIYFANSSSSWENRGVAFLDINTDNEVIGRAYLITREQFHQVWQQEGKGTSWYSKAVYLGKLEDYPIYTFTASSPRGIKIPSEKYLEPLRKGINEIDPSLPDEFITEYLDKAQNHTPSVGCSK